MVVEAPIDWGIVEALPAPSERCEASAAPPHERQVARVIPQQLVPGPGGPLLGHGMLLLLNQLLPTGARTARTASTVDLFIIE